MPEIDPATGEPIESTEPIPPTVAVPAEEWGAMKARLDAFENGTFQQNAAPAAPTTPTGPTIADQVATIETKIDALDTQIDKNVSEGKAVSSLMKERSKYDRQITRLQIKSEDIDPVINAGMQTIDQISSEVSKGKMKYIDIVKSDYDSLLSTIDPSQRSSMEVKQKIYDIAVGQNIDKIMEAQKEEILRKGHDNANDPLPNGNNRTPDSDETPKPSDILSTDAIRSIKSKGLTVDEYYKKMGNPDGWKGYFKKRKQYYEDQGII